MLGGMDEEKPTLDYAMPERRESGLEKWDRRSWKAVVVASWAFGAVLVFVSLWVWVMGIYHWVRG